MHYKLINKKIGTNNIEVLFEFDHPEEIRDVCFFKKNILYLNKDSLFSLELRTIVVLTFLSMFFPNLRDTSLNSIIFISHGLYSNLKYQFG